ncbi:MAG TPA: NAD(P)/FAD-dependent oxidoreductase [Burkholderiales bacterium]|nr:NAD(P)/FAD-dependent oxidoreductase [Burkholderiales bacterium]
MRRDAGMAHDQRILIAGAGPVGAVSALALAQRGFAVSVFEADAQVSTAPRAATTHSATLELLADLDVIDEVIRRGLVARKFQFWDRPSASLVAEFDHAVLERDTRFPFAVQCEQHKLAHIALDRAAALPQTEVHYCARVATVEARADGVRVGVETPAGVRQFDGAFLIGADGGRSTVRKALAIEFEGYTWPERFIVLTTPFDFEGERGYCLRNYFSDPDEWANLFKVAGDDGRGLWRVVFPTRSDETDAAALSDAGVEARLQRFFPKPAPYPVIHRSLYKVHQRVARAFRKGRVFLVGDAAHVNNPIGGLGLNCGIHDAVELAQRLAQFRDRGEDALDLYERRRRPLNIEFVQRQTVDNKKRLEEKDPAARAANFEQLRSTAADPERQRRFLLRTSLIESTRKAASIT